MENLNLLDQIYELEAGCAAIVADAKTRAQNMEIHARQEAEKAMAQAVHEVHENKKNALVARKSGAERTGARPQGEKPDYAEALEEAKHRKSLAVAALLERILS